MKEVGALSLEFRRPDGKEASWGQDNNFDETELDDVCDLMAEELFVSTEAAVQASELPKPFAAFGSYRQRHGDVESINVKTGISSEAPAKLGTGPPRAGEFDLETSVDRGMRATSLPVNIRRPEKQNSSKEQGMRRKVLRPRNRSSEVEREEAWERKRDQHIQEELKEMQEDQKARAVGRSVSDCGERTWPRLQGSSSSLGKSRLRARSLTDEDLDELRGSIDLGFAFNNQADPELWNTLPALELCYAISQQYQNKESPVSTVEDDGTASEGSPTNSPSWAISSPGDHPHQVKTRLRHWAQAVACTVRQNYKQEFC